MAGAKMAGDMAVAVSTNPVSRGHGFRLAFLVGVLIIAGTPLVPMSSASVNFLDVGQGDAILLQHGSQQLLIDGGPGNTVVQRVAQEMPWFDRTIEVVLNTHPDRDHLEGLVHLLDHYKVSLVLLPHIPHTSRLYDEWLARLQKAADLQGTQVRFAAEGQQLILQGVTVAFLSPAAGERPRKINNVSVITHIDFAGLQLLLTGDAEASVERALVARYGPQLKSEVLKIGHHGSKTSTTLELLAAAAPAATVISVGAANTYGHPHPTVLERLREMPTWRTNEHGTVRFVRADSQWLVLCGARRWLRLQEKPCITQAVQTK